MTHKFMIMNYFHDHKFQCYTIMNFMRPNQYDLLLLSVVIIIVI